MFESIQRLEQMYRYYEHFHKSEISKSWNELMESSDKAFPQSLALFYDTVVSTFHTQVCLVCVTLQYQFYNNTVVSTFHTQVCLSVLLYNTNSIIRL